jgi:hypothetical protein
MAEHSPRYAAIPNNIAIDGIAGRFHHSLDQCTAQHSCSSRLTRSSLKDEQSDPITRTDDASGEASGAAKQIDPWCSTSRQQHFIKARGRLLKHAFLLAVAGGESSYTTPVGPMLQRIRALLNMPPNSALPPAPVEVLSAEFRVFDVVTLDVVRDSMI